MHRNPHQPHKRKTNRRRKDITRIKWYIAKKVSARRGINHFRYRRLYNVVYEYTLVLDDNDAYMYIPLRGVPEAVQ